MMIRMMMIKSNADLTGAEMQGNEVDVANLSLRLQDLNTKEAELAGNLKQWREKNGQVVLLSFTKNLHSVLANHEFLVLHLLQVVLDHLEVRFHLSFQ